MISSIAPNNVYVNGSLIVSPGASLIVNRASMINSSVTTSANMVIVRDGSNVFGPLTMSASTSTSASASASLSYVSAPSIIYTREHECIIVTDIARNLSRSVHQQQTDTIPTTGACARYMRAGTCADTSTDSQVSTDILAYDSLCCAYYPSLSVASISCMRKQVDVLAPIEIARKCVIGNTLYYDAQAQAHAQALTRAPKFAGMIVEIRDITYISTPNLTWFAVDTSGRDVSTC